MDSTELNAPGYEIPAEIKGQIAITSLDRIYNWGRSASVWPLMFGLACCAIEMICAAASRYARARRGSRHRAPRTPRRRSKVMGSSLASHAFEHPADAFPEFVEGPAPWLQAGQVAHPLIPEARAVRNDVSLGGRQGTAPRLLVVSGSNMSGKSTLLRTLGTNVVLAAAGAPVRARRLGRTSIPRTCRRAGGRLESRCKSRATRRHRR